MSDRERRVVRGRIAVILTGRNAYVIEYQRPFGFYKRPEEDERDAADSAADSAATHTEQEH